MSGTCLEVGVFVKLENLCSAYLYYHRSDDGNTPKDTNSWTFKQMADFTATMKECHMSKDLISTAESKPENPQSYSASISLLLRSRTSCQLCFFFTQIVQLFFTPLSGALSR